MPRTIAFCLCPGFSLFSVASALDVLRHANRFAARKHYRWAFFGEDGRPVIDNNGLPFPCGNIAEAGRPDVAFVVAGFDAGQISQPRIGSWLQKQARAGCSIGGIANGAFVLAAAGLLNRYSATTHWEDFESFCLMFPEVRARYQRYVIDRNRISCAGGSATLDLFMEIARQDLGNEIALKVSRQMLLREESVIVPGSIASGVTGRRYSAPVQRALSLIEAGVGQSISVNDLALRIGISRRDLLRLFRRELGKPPSRVLAERRLDRARSLVLNTGLPIAGIADSVGFSSQSHLTASYHREFGITPAQQRREYRAARDRLPLMSRDFRDW